MHSNEEIINIHYHNNNNVDRIMYVLGMGVNTRIEGKELSC